MTTTLNHGRLPKDLLYHIVAATQRGALGAATEMGRGDKIAADGAAVKLLTARLMESPMDGVVIIGEGEKDEAPMLANGERVGTGDGPSVDIAVDPLEGTTLTAHAGSNATSTICISPAGTMWDPGRYFYMAKLAVGPDAAGAIDIRLSATENLHHIAEAKSVKAKDLTVVVLDRPRHDPLIEEIRATKARILSIKDGDVWGAMATAVEGSGVDVLMGVGGTPEGVLAAGALKAMGGEIQGYPVNLDKDKKIIPVDFNSTRVLSINDLVAGDEVFFAATGVTDGFLQGVRVRGKTARTETLAVDGLTGDSERIIANHSLGSLRQMGLQFEPGDNASGLVMI